MKNQRKIVKTRRKFSANVDFKKEEMIRKVKKSLKMK